MKTLNLKDAFKLLLFLLILFSAKAFSFTRLPNEANSSGCSSKIGVVKKTTNMPKATTGNYSVVPKSKAMHSKSMASRSSFTPRVSM